MSGLSAGSGSPVLLPRLLPPGKAMPLLLTGWQTLAAGAPAGTLGRLGAQRRHGQACDPVRRPAADPTPGLGGQRALDAAPLGFTGAATVRTSGRNQRMVAEMTPTVLVVNDEPALTEVICAALADAGLCARGCTQAAEAFWFIQRTQPAMVILDVRMPGVDGITKEFSSSKKHPSSGDHNISGVNSTRPVTTARRRATECCIRTRVQNELRIHVARSRHIIPLNEAGMRTAAAMEFERGSAGSWGDGRGPGSVAVPATRPACWIPQPSGGAPVARRGMTTTVVCFTSADTITGQAQAWHWVGLRTATAACSRRTLAPHPGCPGGLRLVGMSTCVSLHHRPTGRTVSEACSCCATIVAPAWQRVPRALLPPPPAPPAPAPGRPLARAETAQSSALSQSLWAAHAAESAG